MKRILEATMTRILEDIVFYALGIPVVLLMSLLWLACRICGVRLEDDF